MRINVLGGILIEGGPYRGFVHSSKSSRKRPPPQKKKSWRKRTAARGVRRLPASQTTTRSHTHFCAHGVERESARQGRRQRAGAGDEDAWRRRRGGCCSSSQGACGSPSRASRRARHCRPLAHACAPPLPLRPPPVSSPQAADAEMLAARAALAAKFGSSGVRAATFSSPPRGRACPSPLPRRAPRPTLAPCPRPPRLCRRALAARARYGGSRRRRPRRRARTTRSWALRSR